MSLLQSLNWRYATKRMNGQKVAQEKLDAILEAARLAPSSVGLQPYKIIVVENEELRKKIQPIANNQPQILEASHLLVFAAWDNLSEQQVNDFLDFTIKERGLEPGALDAYKGYLLPLTQRPAEENFQWNARQAYIAFGIAIAAAAEAGVDATPMEGFNGPALDELLGLKEQGLRSVTLLPLGFRDTDNDWLVNQKKVRRPKEELLVALN